MNNPNIEKAILSTFLFEPESFEKQYKLVSERDFFNPYYKTVFQIMLQLFKNDKPIDDSFIAIELQKLNQDENILHDIMTANPLGNISAYALQLKDDTRKREVYNLSLQIKKDIDEGMDSEYLLSNIQESIEEIQNNQLKQTKSTNLKTLMDEAKTRKKPPICQTGISFIDAIYKKQGLELGQLIGVGGSAEAGKTRLTLQILRSVSLGHKSVYFSFEFDKDDYAEAMTHNKNQYNPLNIEIEDEGTDIMEVEHNIKKWASKGFKFFVIDSMMDMTNKMITDSKESRVSDMFRRLKELSKSQKVIIFIIVQTSKADHKTGEISVKWSNDADHALKQFWFIDWDKKSPKRILTFRKNKQDGKHANIEMYLNENLEFQDFQDGKVETYYYTAANKIEVPII
jgi:replicative DNA helicase